MENYKGLLKPTNQLENHWTEGTELKLLSLEVILGWKSQFKTLRRFAQDQDLQLARDMDTDMQHQGKATEEQEVEVLTQEAEVHTLAEAAHSGWYQLKKRKDNGFLASKFVMSTDIVITNEDNN